MSSLSIVVLCSVFSDPSFYMSKQRQESVCHILPHVVEEADKNGVDPFLLMGLITVESNWKTTAVSHAPACGLTQVMPKYTGGRATSGKKYTCEELKNPRVGVSVGAEVLAWWIKQYGEGNVPVGLCGYFSGFRCKPKINEPGEKYFKKVLRFKNKIESKYQERTTGD